MILNPASFNNDAASLTQASSSGCCSLAANCSSKFRICLASRTASGRAILSDSSSSRFRLYLISVIWLPVSLFMGLNPQVVAAHRGIQSVHRSRPTLHRRAACSDTDAQTLTNSLIQSQTAQLAYRQRQAGHNHWVGTRGFGVPHTVVLLLVHAWRFRDEESVGGGGASKNRSVRGSFSNDQRLSMLPSVRRTTQLIVLLIPLQLTGND